MPNTLDNSDAPKYNLDVDSDHFDFTVNNHLYRFKHMTMADLNDMDKLRDQEQELGKFFSQFITKVNDDSPDFEEISKTFIVPNWRKFHEMVRAEFSVK